MFIKRMLNFLLNTVLAPLFMTSNTGRTVEKFVYVIVGNSANNQLNELAVDSIGDVGLASEWKDVSAWQDAVKNGLTGQPGAPIKITGPFDTSAAQAAPTSGQAHALSGSHTVLSALCGDGKPHTLMIALGVQHVYTTNEPVFGLQWASASNSGYTCTKYTVNGSKYSAEFEVMGAIAPAWGTALLTIGS
jgi:hypothetical protein